MNAPTDQYLRDRLAILDTVTAYFIAIDHREFDRLDQVFSADAVADFDGKAVGPGLEAIIDFVAGRGKIDYPVDIQNLQLSQHQISNHVVRIDGDTGWSETYAVAYLVDRPDSGPRMRTRGLRYQDVLTRTADGWRVSDRTHVCDWMRLDALEWAATGITPLPDQLRS
ncbi:MAG: nuclear transport factor 2 family protein [Acidimicrobiales bacterium]